MPYFWRRQVTKGTVYLYYEFVSEQLMDDARVARDFHPGNIPLGSVLYLSGVCRVSSEQSLLTVLAAVAAALFLSVVPARGSGENPETEVRLLFTGDILLYARSGKAIEPQSAIFQPRIESHYVGGRSGGREPGRGRRPQEGCLESSEQAPCFPIRKEFVPLLRAAGFGAIGMANNHSSDLVRRRGRQPAGSLDKMI